MRIKFILIIFFCLIATLALADVAPRPTTFLGGPRSKKSNQLGDRKAVSTGVSMEGAYVHVRIRTKTDPGDKGPGSQLDPRFINETKWDNAELGPGNKGPELFAVVTAEFEMKCSKDLGWESPKRRDKQGRVREYPPLGISVEFPVARENADARLSRILGGLWKITYDPSRTPTDSRESYPKPLQFAAQIDGEPAPVSFELWPETDEKGQKHSLLGYRWHLQHLKRGQILRISAQYLLALPQKEGKANFLYSLRSGAYWDGPIGWETVYISAEKGLDMQVLAPSAPKPEKSDDGSLTWRIVKKKPTEDIQLIVQRTGQ